MVRQRFTLTISLALALAAATAPAAWASPSRLYAPVNVASRAPLGVALATPAAASTSSVSYSLTGSGSSVPGSGSGCLDCQAPTMNASGTAACSVCIAGKPTSGSFTISLGVRIFPPNPCKVKSVSGTLQMSWNDGTTSTATVAGKFRDSKALALSGAFDPADPVYADDATTLLLHNYPPNPCVAATNEITGTLAIGAP